MKVSTDALLRTLQVIVDECDISDDALTSTICHSELFAGSLRMSIWGIHCATGYSTEYTRQVVKQLYWDIGALQRTKKGAKFLYMPTANASKAIKKLEKESK